jgi:hypothetical protein
VSIGVYFILIPTLIELYKWYERREAEEAAMIAEMEARADEDGGDVDAGAGADGGASLSFPAV